MRTNLRVAVVVVELLKINAGEEALVLLILAEQMLAAVPGPRISHVKPEVNERNPPASRAQDGVFGKRRVSLNNRHFVLCPLAGFTER